MDLDLTYQKILSEIDKGSRGLVRYSPDELRELTQLFEQQLKETDPSVFEKVLCLVDHSAADHLAWEPLILMTLRKDLPPALLVFGLNCARKHILQARFKRGHRLDYEFLETMKRLLFSSHPEVVEWTLRTIEECGSQGVYFLSEFDKIKPPPWKWFNAHQRAIREIIELLERRWSKFEKS